VASYPFFDPNFSQNRHLTIGVTMRYPWFMNLVQHLKLWQQTAALEEGIFAKKT